MTSEIVALDRFNNVAVFVTDAPVKSVAMICPLSKGLSFNTITAECKQTEEHSVLRTQFRNVSIILSTLSIS
jgi:hypothetical protein